MDAKERAENIWKLATEFEEAATVLVKTIIKERSLGARTRSILPFQSEVKDSEGQLTLNMHVNI
jgi:hypothetical protein